jgi:hypothetical protein
MPVVDLLNMSRLLLDMKARVALPNGRASKTSNSALSIRTDHHTLTRASGARYSLRPG